jgi:hypothetical protein
MSRYSDAIKILGPKIHETIRTTPVLVVGAGGIGSELRASSRSLVASTGVVRREVRIRALTDSTSVFARAVKNMVLVGFEDITIVRRQRDS